MFFLFLLLIVLLILEGFVSLEEETLILVASAFWIDAAGGFIRENLESELVHKGDMVKENYVYFLELKRRTLVDLIELHEERLKITSSFMKPLRSYLFFSLLGNALSHYYGNMLIDMKYRCQNELLEFGLVAINDFFLTRLESILSSNRTV